MYNKPTTPISRRATNVPSTLFGSVHCLLLSNLFSIKEVLGVWNLKKKTCFFHKRRVVFLFAKAYLNVIEGSTVVYRLGTVVYSTFWANPMIYKNVKVRSILEEL